MRLAKSSANMEDFSTLESNIKSALTSTVRSAVSLANQDIQFHRSLDSAVGTALDQHNGRLLGLAERLLGAATANTEIVRPPRLKDLDSVEGNWKAVVDVVDSLLERADTALDEFTGAVKRLSPGVEQASGNKSVRGGRIAHALKEQNISKPQLQFHHVPTNDETVPFKPLLENKPHAITPIQTEPDAPEAQYRHPYQQEIEQYQYPSRVYVESEPIMYHPFETTTATLVDTEEALEEMLEELKQAKEIAIDLEHHDQRSYIGIVSLMQISTRDKDWIVDTLKPWRRKLQCLNEVFTDPNIIKVLHGAYMDMMWLQRDLGLYVVGLFDTHHASRALGYTGGSLAFLLRKFANVDAQKQHQTADWRVRPLPKELFDYARSDTHYLLYIFDNMRNELIQKSDFSKPDHEGDKIWRVLKRSSEEALQRYEHPVYDAELGQGGFGWYRMLAKTSVMLTKEQFAVFRAVHQWRDRVAREQDDGVHFVMPNHQIFTIAKAMPPNRLALLGIATPTTQSVRLRADELVSVIQKAKEKGQNGPDMMEVLNKVEPQRMRTEPVARSQPAGSPVTTATSSRPNMITSPSSLPMRSTMSSFWGPAFESSAWTQNRQMSTPAGVSLAIPLPPLTAEIFASPAEAEPIKGSTPELQSVPQEEPRGDEAFKLRDFRKKPKRKADQMAANSDEVALPDEAAERAREKAAREAARRAAKKAQRQSAASAAAMEGVEAGEVEQTPFDYASAPSILNPPQERSSAKEKKQRERQIDPYKKSLDAPKGLGRTQKEGPGRSLTYKG